MNQPRTQRFNLSQRIIQGFFGTREFGVLVLILVCILAEAGVLAATRRFGVITATPETAFLWGMSAISLIIFCVELLKLPVAWVSGLVAGRRMIVLNAVTFLLCCLTAMTIKDLTIWEWNKTLAPARQVYYQADVPQGRYEALERQLNDLAGSIKQGREAHMARLNQLKGLRDAQQASLTDLTKRYTDDLNGLDRELIDPRIRSEIDSKTKEREQSLVTIEADIAALNKQLESQRGPQGPLPPEVRDEIAARQQAYEDARKRVQDELATQLATLGPEPAFDWGSKHQKAVEDAQQSAKLELERLFNEKESQIARITGGSSSGSIQKALVDQIAAKQQERETRRAQYERDLEALRQKGMRGGVPAVERRRRQIEDDFKTKSAMVYAEIEAYDRAIREETERGKALSLSPDEIERRRQEISTELPALKAQADSLIAQAEELAQNTAAGRTASGLIRWFMPAASFRKQVEAAYAIFPLLFGVLVAFLPAVLLELAVFNVRPEVRRAESERQSWFTRLSRGRKALQALRGRARRAAENAEASLRQLALQQEKVSLEHALRNSNFDREIEDRLATSLQELRAAKDQLETDLAGARDREASLGKQLADLSQQLSKMAADNRLLAIQVVHLDATVAREKP